MSKVKRVLAIIGIILLVGLYVSTIVCALLDDPRTFHFLGAAIVASILVPAIIWLVGMFIKIGKPDE